MTPKCDCMNPRITPTGHAPGANPVFKCHGCNQQWWVDKDGKLLNEKPTEWKSTTQQRPQAQQHGDWYKGAKKEAPGPVPEKLSRGDYYRLDQIGWSENGRYLL